MHSSWNGEFSLLASRTQQYEAVTAVAHTTSAHPVIIIIIVVVVVFVIIISSSSSSSSSSISITIITLLYFDKIIQNKIYIKIRHSYKKLANKNDKN